MGKVFVHKPYNPNRLAHGQAPDPEVIRELQAKQADEQLLQQWTVEERQSRAANRALIKQENRELERLLHKENKPPDRILLFEPELINALEGIFNENKYRRRCIIRRIRERTKDMAISYDMLKTAIDWLAEFAWGQASCMGCGVEMGVSNLGGRVPFEVVIVMPGVRVGGLCLDCFEAPDKYDLIRARLK